MLDPRSPVGRLVLDHATAARVLQRHRIDFCCHGERSLAEACAERGVSLEQLHRDLARSIAEDRDPRPVDPRTLSDKELIDLIVLRHHGYLREVLPYVLELSEIVSSVHGCAFRPS